MVYARERFQRWGLALVPDYRVYTIGTVSGHFIGREEFACPSDEAALERAKQFADGHAVELWEGERFIARIDGHAKPPAS